jgi:HK97 family phage major capsid protein
MSNANELRAESLKIQHQAKAKLQEITSATPEARAKEIETEFDRMLSDADALESRAKRFDDLEARDRAYEAAADAGARRPVEDRSASTLSAEQIRNAAFNAYVRGNELNSEHRAALREHRDMSVGTTTAGGYAVPTLWADQITVAMKDYGEMLTPVVNQMTTSTGVDINFPTNDDTGNIGAIIGENTAVSTQDLVFGNITLKAYKYTSKLIRVSNELLADNSYDIGSYITTRLGERIGRAVNAHATTGTGSAQPMGLFTAATSSVTTAANTVVAYDELLDLVHSVDLAYRKHPTAGFMFSDSTFKALRKLKDSNGNPLWVPGLANGEAGTLMGYRFSVNNDAPAFAPTAKAIVFGKLTGYTVRQSGPVVLKRLDERYADQDSVGFLAFARFDGNLLETSALKALTIKV